MNAALDLIRALIDTAVHLPFLVWVTILGFGVAVWLAYEIATAPLITEEQAEEIARAHRELRGARGMPSTRNPAVTTRRTHGGGAPLTRHRGADPDGPVWRGRPRRAR